MFPINWFFNGFNRGFEWLSAGYGRLTARTIRLTSVALVIYAGLLFLTYNRLDSTPTGLIPQLDRGYFITVIQLPPGSTLERADKVVRRASELIMVEESIDVAIRIGRLPDSSFMARKIGDDVRLVCAAPGYLAAHRAPRRPEDLAGHNCILSRDRAHLNRWPFRIDGQVREIEVDGRVAVSEGEAQLRLGLQGLGIVRLTRLTVATAIKRGELVPLLLDYSAEEPVPIHAVYPHRRHLAAKVTAFIDFIVEKFTPPPWEI